MITRESFIKVMNVIKKQNMLDEKHGKLLGKLADPNSDFREVVFTTPMIQDMIDTLVVEMKCKSDEHIGNDIEYWIYEAEYGKKYNTIWQDSKAISIATAGDLYDFLINKPNYTAGREL